MELKKSPKADLQTKRSAFLLTGIAVSMLIVISLFSWSQSEKTIETMAATTEVAEVEMAEITVQEDKPAPEVIKAPIAVSEMLNIVSNDAKITTDVTFFDDEMVTSGPIVVKSFSQKSVGETEAEDEIPVVLADEMPQFMGKDVSEFRAWCQKNMKYPPMAADNGVEGTVTLKFVVERDGSVSNVQVLRGRDRELDAAAVKQVMSSPKWTPGKNRGKAVRVTYTIPIVFKLQ